MPNEGVDNSEDTNIFFSQLDSECPHSKKIFNLIDSDELYASNSFTEHIWSCNHCEKKVVETRKIMSKIDEQIPARALDVDMSKAFSREVDEILKDFSSRSVKNHRYNNKNIEFVYAFFKDLCKIVFSRKLLILYSIVVALNMLVSIK